MEKQQRIIQMFNDISPTYDRLNRILSFGVDRRWRRNGCLAALKAHGRPVKHLVDVATGTGDLILFWREAGKASGTPIERATGLDPAIGMLTLARRKVKNADFQEAQANALPLEDNSADMVSISYGIRNVVDVDGALKEFHRVLEPGGHVLILEFMSHPESTLMDRMSRLYMNKVLPKVGAMISKDNQAYTYLPESIQAFFSTEQLVEKLATAGFEIVQVKDDTFGISTRFIARKPG
ncbi:ubiquinone biosynthesis methyltransferase UbiE [Ectothiorhodospira haloalkaliphila]|uniref:Ubiquinone/menaquinone biosynthesis C-methyltransferase UbiE n=1 Tax=Ectothiorhodospira haloalkaliphila TaxID=421628 RepID=W8KMT9_9GAMM|nr:MULTISPECIES: bifunctional demethylmenaquinone methyltransferase/2-methoxy-6-polyprenyl-1,4-benzoquinol methylase UbiE [Ectothiorhodospira]AHK78322.1 ubiquinone biosynthesis methyltransferase UbiE [Ectothiorhodospira haloalkaliphila]MCG5495790.1 bifunctional demethylmenaquinone methyltransferase/2-methoxy-6-polyprenyl-1,4-benzoquinol methylase UbiE [Ectothiorhodospira variabilis]MCG5504776.1 bifunctional demethylmenaquinone methyltransferase/2-methoxy-6-polyprenyl-1,4-benzoquinol methylase Ub